jgi:hypothetical protein
MPPPPSNFNFNCKHGRRRTRCKHCRHLGCQESVWAGAERAVREPLESNQESAGACCPQEASAAGGVTGAACRGAGKAGAALTGQGGGGGAGGGARQGYRNGDGHGDGDGDADADADADADGDGGSGSGVLTSVKGGDCKVGRPCRILLLLLLQSSLT